MTPSHPPHRVPTEAPIAEGRADDTGLADRGGRGGPLGSLGELGRDGRLLLSARVALSAARALSGVVVPIYLALLGFSALELGLLFLVVGLCSAGLSGLSGLAADRLGRKPFLVGVPWLVAGAAVTFALTHSPPVLFVAASLGSFGRGGGAGGGAAGPYQPAASAVQAGLAPAHRRNHVFGLFAAGSMVGALLGSVLATLPDAAKRAGLGGAAAYAPAFVVVAALAALAGLLALPLAVTGPTRPGPSRRGPVRLSSESRSLIKRLGATNALTGLSLGLFAPFLPYWFHVRFGAGPGEVGLLFALVNIVSVGSTLLAAPSAKRVGTVTMIVAARVVGALMLVPMAVAPSFALAGAFYCLRQVLGRMGMPLRQSYTMALADPAQRSSVAGLSNLSSQVTMSASPVLAGGLFEAVNLSLPFELASLLQLANAGLFYAFFHHRPPAEERPVADEVGPPEKWPAELDPLAEEAGEPEATLALARGASGPKPRRRR